MVTSKRYVLWFAMYGFVAGCFFDGDKLFSITCETEGSPCGSGLICRNESCLPPICDEICYDGPSDTLTEGRPCLAGTLDCDDEETCVGQVLPSDETCNGVDEDCDGTVDEGATCSGGLVCEDGRCVPPECDESCYDGPAGTIATGIPCQAGVLDCSGTPTCVGQTLPQTEICNNVDDDCNGTVDDGTSMCSGGLVCQNGTCVSAACGQPCYDGPIGTNGVGPCVTGILDCSGTPTCVGQVLPATETCNGADDNCNGTVDEAAPDCTGGTPVCCAATCVDLDTNSSHCGQCNMPCGLTCSSGVCS